MTVATTFAYHIHWRARGYHDGYHRGTQGGLGMEFRGNVPLADYPDARRVDLRQTLRDPMEQVHVRIYNQKSPVPVYAACDLSGSMGYAGKRSKLRLASEIAACIGHSAWENSDAYGFIGFDDVVREDWLSPPSRQLDQGLALADRLSQHQPGMRGSAGMLNLTHHLSAQRALVFLISDFHLPLDLLEQALNTLSQHQVVPVVLWDTQEYAALPRFGLSTIVDPETGTRRTLLFRGELRERFRRAFAERRERLTSLLLQYEMPPCFIEDAFEPQMLSDYFHQFSA